MGRETLLLLHRVLAYLLFAEEENDYSTCFAEELRVNLAQTSVYHVQNEYLGRDRTDR